MELPLAGVRIVDCSAVISGPLATTLLADQGADVIKVEGLPNGDPSRESGPFHDGQSVYFMCSNRNKRSLAVDLRNPDGRALVADLVAEADVVVQNFKPGTMERIGLGYDEVRARNPRIVYCDIRSPSPKTYQNMMLPKFVPWKPELFSVSVNTNPMDLWSSGTMMQTSTMNATPAMCQ